MSYHRGSSSGHPQSHHTTWGLASAPPTMSSGPPSASPFSPAYHASRPPTRNISEIIPRLYISDLAFAENPALLTSYRITHILSTMSDTIFRPPPSLLPVQPIRMQIRVEDLPFAELAEHLPHTTEFIRAALDSHPEARILVHCAEGVSRSVSVVAAYLMAQFGYTPVEALAYIKGRRRVANPNFGFVKQLHEYARNALGRPIPDPVLPAFSP